MAETEPVEQPYNDDIINVPASGEQWAADHRTALENAIAAAEADLHGQFGPYAAQVHMWAAKTNQILYELSNHVVHQVPVVDGA